MKSIVAILIALILIVGSLGVFVYVRLSPFGAPSDDNITTANIIERLTYVENTVAQTPQQLMEQMLEILTLMYANVVTEDMFFTEILRVQRTLFGREMTYLNTFDTQHMQFMHTLAQSRERDQYQLSIEIVHMEEMYEDFWVAHVSQLVNNLGTVNWAYYIVYENGWKVEAFFMADDLFRPFRIDLQAL